MLQRLLTTLIILTSCSLFGQNSAQTAVNYSKAYQSHRLSAFTQTLQFAELYDWQKVNEDNAIGFVKKQYQLNEDYQLSVINTLEDELGYKHVRYQLSYKQVPILGSVLIFHIKQGVLKSFNGEVFKINDTNNAIVKSENEALQLALDSFKAETYMWQSPEEEAIIKDIQSDPKATWFPKATLMYVPMQLDFSRSDFKLTYKFNIHAISPRKAENVYVDVKTGQVVAQENQLHAIDVLGKAYTKYSGLKTITTDSTAPFNYRLRDNSRGNGVYTYNLKKSTNYGTAVDFLDSNNIWNNVNINKDEVATDCHWGAETTYDYYKTKFNRNSYNNANARINSYVHYSTNYDNAFWDGIRMTYGDGNTFKPLTSMDVCGHEITHAVTSNSANLIYSYQSGQLNESFSDIFGNTIERYGKPTGYSWKIGEEITTSGNGLRNMADPRTNGHPRCYLGTYWYTGAGDNGGVHLNSGVQNWWYYLITEGGTGTNDFTNAYKVDSLGILSAEKIAYRNLTVYLTPSSQYADSRFYSIQAAKDLFGQCSKEVISVTNAWYACNVGPKYDSGYVKANFTADTVVCSSSKLVNFYNLSSNALTYKWTFGDATTSTVANPSHTYSAFGNYTIKLVATSCFKNKKDSLTKTAYVKIDSTFDICNAVLMPASGIDSTRKCRSFVYDDGGEDIYKQGKITYLRISAPGADSIRIKFYDFDYELNYDSLYIYKGYYPGTGTKIGGYTGSTLPNAGNNFLVAGSVVTLRHVSDPYVTGRGFKLLYTAIKKPVKVKAFSDTTICMGTKALLRATGTGGYFKDYFYKWDNNVFNDTNIVSPTAYQAYKVYLKDVCTNGIDSAIVKVTVRDPLELATSSDTIICRGGSAKLSAKALGGKNSSYVYTWDQGLGTGASKTVSPQYTTVYRVIVSDGCTPVSDTAFVKVYVKDSLYVKALTTDTLICFNKVSQLATKASGGDTLNYTYTWSNGLGFGSTLNATLNTSQWVKVTLTDACSSTPASDSVYVVVRPQLKVNLNNDTTLCKGRGAKLNAFSTGGDSKKYHYKWTPANADTSIINVQPIFKTKYKVELTDNCSDKAVDSITVDVLGPIVITGLKDTTICNGMKVPLQAVVTGGKPSSYTYTWNLGLPSVANQLVAPIGNTKYQVIVRDGCTVLGDTAYAQVDVKGTLKPKINTNDTLICFQNTASFNVTTTGGNPSNYTYLWNNGMGTNANASKAFGATTWVKVTVNDACTVTPGVDSVLVKVRQPLVVRLPKDTLICYGSTAAFSANAAGGDTATHAYTWNLGLPSQKNQTLTLTNKATVIVALNDLCSATSSDTMVINVMPKLKINGLRDTIICFGNKVPLKPVVTGGISSQYQYTWSQGLGSAANQLVAPSTLTFYKLRVDDACSNPSDSVTIKIDVKPTLSLSAQLSDYSICLGDTTHLNFNMSGGMVSQYQWTINGVNSNVSSIKYQPSTTTQYIVKLQDNCSQPVSDTVKVFVNPIPVVDFTVNKTTICKNELVWFTNQSTGAQDYQWYFTSSDSSNAIDPVYKYTQAGVFDVQLKAISDSGCVNIKQKLAYMTVVDLPKAQFTYLPQEPDYIKRDVSFQNNSLNQSTFEWSFGDFTKETSVSSPIHNYPDTGHFPVRLIVKNSIGCADTAYQMLRVKDIFRVFIPDAISMNHDLINDSLIVLGRGILTYNLKIFNRWGEMLYNGYMGDAPFNGRDSKGTPLMKGTYLIYLSVRDFEGYMHYIRQTFEIL
ncbi:MAG: hypothetical protein RLZZ318_426 [Bacteroidota bacterium]